MLLDGASVPYGTVHRNIVVIARRTVSRTGQRSTRKEERLILLERRVGIFYANS